VERHILEMLDINAHIQVGGGNQERQLEDQQERQLEDQQERQLEDQQENDEGNQTFL